MSPTCNGLTETFTYDLRRESIIQIGQGVAKALRHENNMNEVLSGEDGMNLEAVDKQNSTCAHIGRLASLIKHLAQNN